MAIPDSPLTRSEEYLNNIATGEGAIPDVPLTRIEQYLDYIAKNGGSGGGGSGGGVMVVNLHFEPDGGKTGGMNIVCDKTADEMFQAIETKSVVLKAEISETEAAAYMHIISADNTDGYTFLAYNVGGNRITFTSTTADGYPSSSAQ